jgi:hypothetical protein
MLSGMFFAFFILWIDMFGGTQIVIYVFSCPFVVAMPFFPATRIIVFTISPAGESQDKGSRLFTVSCIGFENIR